MHTDIDNFRITETPHTVELWFRRSFKDNFDLFFSLLFTAFAAWMTFFVFRDGMAGLNGGRLALGIFLIIITLLLAADLWTRLISPVGRLLWIDRQARTLSVRPNIFQTRTWPLQEVAGLTSRERGARPNPLHYIRRTLPRTLRLRLKNGRLVTLATLPTTSIIQLGIKHPRTEAILRAKRVAQEVNRYLTGSANSR